MTPAQREAIQKAITEFKLKSELIRADYQKKVKEILEGTRQRRISEIKKSFDK